jgi:L-asparaginase/Glu-tRNA(Gln) amidotransferase subunit D
MNFESQNFGEEINKHKETPTLETPEAIEKKIEGSVTEIMSFEDAGEVEKMAIAAKVAETFTPEDGQKLIDRVAEEIQKSKVPQGKKAA